MTVRSLRNGLAANRRFRVRPAHERPGAAYDYFLQQIVERQALLLPPRLAACVQKIAVQVADTGGGEIAAVAPGDKRDLVVKVE